MRFCKKVFVKKSYNFKIIKKAMFNASIAFFYYALNFGMALCSTRPIINKKRKRVLDEKKEKFVSTSWLGNKFVYERFIVC